MTDPDPSAAFVAEATAMLAAQGFPRIPAALLMALTASEEGRLGARELGARLGVSPAAVSSAVAYLRLLGYVQVTTPPGSRRHVYALPDRSWYTDSLVGTDRYSRMAELMEGHAARLPPDSAARARIAETAAFFRFLERRMPTLLDEWHAERP